jgi:hypothetical protein
MVTFTVPGANGAAVSVPLKLSRPELGALVTSLAGRVEPASDGGADVASDVDALGALLTAALDVLRLAEATADAKLKIELHCVLSDVSPRPCSS